MSHFLSRLLQFFKTLFQRAQPAKRASKLRQKAISTHWTRSTKGKASRPLLAETEVASLRSWLGSSEYKAFRKLVESRAAGAAETILTTDDTTATTRARGALDAYTDVYTLTERIIPLTEAFYARAAERERRDADDRDNATDFSRHLGSPFFDRHWN